MRFISGHNTRGETNPFWRGEEVRYSGVHKWLQRNYPKTGVCEHCGDTGYTEYAYVGDDPRGFERDRAKYVELDAKCHRILDENPVATGVYSAYRMRYPTGRRAA